MKERMDNGYGDFIATDLKYIPFTDKKAMWKIDTAFVVIGSDTLPTVRIAGDLPLTEIKGAPKKENMFFGKALTNPINEVSFVLIAQLIHLLVIQLKYVQYRVEISGPKTSFWLVHSSLINRHVLLEHNAQWSSRAYRK